MKPEDLIDNLDNDIVEPSTITHLFPNLESIERQKIYVYRSLKYTRSIYEDMDVFENAVLVLNGISPNVEYMEGVLPEQIWKALLLINEVNPGIEFSHEVLMYIKMIFSNDGFVFYPPNIGLDNPYLAKIVKKSESGPFPLEEDFFGVQAAKYLKLITYLGDSNAG